MELSFKSDFGPALGQSPSGTPISLDPTQRAIQLDVERKAVRASRIFNVLNVDKNFPLSLDRRFRIKGRIERGPSGILAGMYESWRTTPPSCTAPRNKNFGSFLFDIRDPATAVRFPGSTTDQNIQVLSGHSIRRIISINHANIVTSLSHCFESVRTAVQDGNGVFYTDSFFTHTFSEPGSFRIRQFISPGFQDLTFPRGFIRANDPWSGLYTYNGSPGLQNIERAILRMKN